MISVTSQNSSRHNMPWEENSKKIQHGKDTKGSSRTESAYSSGIHDTFVKIAANAFQISLLGLTRTQSSNLEEVVGNAIKESYRTISELVDLYCSECGYNIDLALENKMNTIARQRKNEVEITKDIDEFVDTYIGAICNHVNSSTLLLTHMLHSIFGKKHLLPDSDMVLLLDENLIERVKMAVNSYITSISHTLQSSEDHSAHQCKTGRILANDYFSELNKILIDENEKVKDKIVERIVDINKKSKKLISALGKTYSKAESSSLSKNNNSITKAEEATTAFGPQVIESAEDYLSPLSPNSNEGSKTDSKSLHSTIYNILAKNSIRFFYKNPRNKSKSSTATADNKENTQCINILKYVNRLSWRKPYKNMQSRTASTSNRDFSRKIGIKNFIRNCFFSSTASALLFIQDIVAGISDIFV